MKKLLLTLLTVVAFLLPASATQTVSGNVKDIVGSAVTNAYVQFDLTGCDLRKFTPRVSGAIIGKYVKQFPVDSTGAFSGTVYGNDEISCNGAYTTLYRTQIFVNGKNIGWTKYYTIKTTDPAFDLNTAADVTGSVSLASNSPTACVGAACWLTGVGAPVGGCTNGAIYTRTDNSSTLYICDNSAWVAVSSGGGSFDTLAGGTNTAAVMVVGTGSSLGYSGSGSINANQYKGGSASGIGACGTHQYTITLNDGAAPTCAQPSSADLSDIATLHAATASALSGSPGQCGANNYSTGITTAGNANCTTISSSNLSDSSHVVKDNVAATFGAFLYDFSSAKLKPPHTVVASLPTASASQYFIYIVTDGATSTDCTSGSGSTYVWCTSNGTAWVALAGAGAGGSGTVNSGTAGQLAWYATTGSAVSGNTGASVDSSGNLTAPKYTASGSNGGLDGTEGTGAGLTAATGHDLFWPDSTAHRWKFNNNNGGADNIVGAATTDTFTNKTLDTSGTGNVFKIAGTQITAIAGNTGTVATTTGAFTNGNCVETDVNHNLKDTGAPCGSGSGGWIQAPATTHDNDTGTYNNDVTVTIGGCSGGTKYFSTDGTAVSAYSTPVSITATGTTLQSRCEATGYDPSATKSSTYTLTVATPSYSPGAGTYATTQSVTISNSTASATLKYCTDGTNTCDPTAGTTYSTPVSIASTSYLRAIGSKTNYNNSAIQSALYTISAGGTPTYHSACGNESGTYAGSVACSLGVTAGSTVVVACALNSNNSTFTVTDSNTNSYASEGSVTAPGTSQLAVYVAKNVAANASLTVTCQPATNPGNRTIVAFDIDGANATTPVDVNGATASGTVTGGGTVTSASFTTTSANEVIIPFLLDEAGTTISAGTGYSNLTTDGFNFQGGEEKTVSATQSGVTASFALANTSGWAIYVVSIK